MARLRLSTTVNAPIEKLFERVTAYGSDGPLDDDVFRKEYGDILEEDGDTFTTMEEIVRYADEEPEHNTWRVTFRYPVQRTMEALDSTWAHRVDTLRETDSGTRWTIRWNTRTSGSRGVIQWLYFRIRGNRKVRRDIVDPVVAAVLGEKGPEA